MSADQVPSSTLPPVEESLAWEAEQRPRAVLAAAVGGLLSFAGAVLFAVLYGGAPGEDEGFISLPEALDARLDGSAPDGESLLVRQVDYYGDNLFGLGAAAVLTAIGAAALAYVLIYLYRAIAARAVISKTPLIASIIGLVAFPIGHVVQRLAAWIGSANFQDEEVRTAETARDVFQNSFVAAGQIVELLGQFALSAAIVMVALNAMRVGLLTRFLGVLGIIVGVLAFPLLAGLDSPQLIRMWWLFGIALLLAGKLRGGLPPAWVTGRVEAWPTQQQVREQREAAAGGSAGGNVTLTKDAAGTTESSAAAAQRRKRKKRR